MAKFPAVRRPNILFINTDQQSSTMMSCTGNPFLKTPAMDRLAREGIRFDRAYSPNPVCVPARFSFFTGRLPSEIGLRHNKSIPKGQALPPIIHQNSAGQLLKRAGYKVAYGGKTHLPGDLSPESMGCEVVSTDKRQDLADASAAWIRQQGSQGDQPFFLSLCFVNPHDICFVGMRNFVRNIRGNATDLNANEKWLLSDESVEMKVLNEALSIPRGMTEEEFFTHHCPPLPPNHRPQDDEPEALQMLVREEQFRSYLRQHWTEKDWRLHRWAYARLTERVDAEIGTVIKALDEAGLTVNTLVVFTSDHGDHAGSHQLDQKTIPYEEAVRIPLLLRWPGGINPGQVDHHHVVSNGLDLLPTFCDAAGCDIPEDLIGESLLPLTAEAGNLWRRRATPIEWINGRGLVMDHLKYLRYDEGLHREQLMDLEKDPLETKNHLNDPNLQDELAACRSIFAQFFHS